MEGKPDESVRCPGCGSSEDFVVTYDSGATDTVIRFTQYGLDEEGNAIYVANALKGKPITSKSKFSSAWCGSCGGGIPSFFVGANRYVRLACSAQD